MERKGGGIWKTAATINAIDNPLRFPGQYEDKKGVHYNYYRFFSINSGRYFERDPIGLAGGVNVFGYVKSNPITASDNYGLYSSSLDAMLSYHFYFGGGKHFSINKSLCGKYKSDQGVKSIISSISKDIREKTKAAAIRLEEGQSFDYTVAGSRDNMFDLDIFWSFGNGKEKWDVRCTATKISCNCATSSCEGAIGRKDWFTDPVDLHERWGFGETPFSPEANLGGIPFTFSIVCDYGYATTQCI